MLLASDARDHIGSVPVDYLLPILGACAVIVAAQGRGMRGWLSGRVPAWLGRISYSLYLVHCVVLKLIATVWPYGGSPIALAPAGIALSLAAATILQRTVEAPAIRLSKPRGPRVRRSPQSGGAVSRWTKRTLRRPSPVRA